MDINNFLEGHVDIIVDWDGKHILNADVSSVRPNVADHLLKGRPVEEAPVMLGRLFTLCGTSQGMAARLACDAATGRAQDDGVFRSAQWGVITELLREHLWRMLMDWPQRLGGQPEIVHMQGLLRGLPSPQSSVDDISRFRDKVAGIIFGESADAWLENGNMDNWQAWAERQNTSIARLMSEVWRMAQEIKLDPQLLPHPFETSDARELNEQMVTNPGFSQEPSWHDGAVETGPLSRMIHHPVLTDASGLLVARMLSRLAEIPVMIRRLEQLVGGDTKLDIAGQMKLSEDEGCAWVETSRGLLVHRVRTENGELRQYQIVAPTEWNFHPKGPCRRALASISANTEEMLRRSIDLVVTALDPCVHYQVKIRHA